MPVDRRPGVPNSGAATLPASMPAGSVHQLLTPGTLAVFAPSQLTLDYNRGTVPALVSVHDAPGTITNPANLPAARFYAQLGAGGGTVSNDVRHVTMEGYRDFEDDVLVTTDGNQDAIIAASIAGHEVRGGQPGGS